MNKTINILKLTTKSKDTPVVSKKITVYNLIFKAKIHIIASPMMPFANKILSINDS